MHSLRTRLVVGTIAATAVVLAVFGTALYLAIRAAVTTEFDEAITNKARALAAMVEIRANKKFIIELEDWQMPEFHAATRPEYFQIQWEEGKTSVRSKSLRGRDLPMNVEPSGEPRFESISLPDGRPGKVVTIRFEPRLEDTSAEPPPSGHAILALARDTLGIQRVMARIGWLLVMLCGGATLASIGLMLWIVRRSLSPIDALAARIARVGDANLSERIVADGAPAELRPLVSRLNELLGRLDQTFAREKAFSADVAHELRTPLAGLETALDVAASQPRDSREYERVIARCLNVTRRMHAMIDNLLTLARAEAGQLKLTAESVCIEKLLRESWAAYEPRAKEKSLDVSWSVNGSCQLRTDREMLRLVLQNLLDNAVSYCNAGGKISVAVSGDNGALAVKVVNTGSGVSSEDSQRVFERFWRADESRDASHSHSGLGLTLCRNVVSALGGSIDVHAERNGEFGAVVKLPR